MQVDNHVIIRHLIWPILPNFLLICEWCHTNPIYIFPTSKYGIFHFFLFQKPYPWTEYFKCWGCLPCKANLLLNVTLKNCVLSLMIKSVSMSYYFREGSTSFQIVKGCFMSAKMNLIPEAWSQNVVKDSIKSK